MTPPSPPDVVHSFIDRINQGDIDSLVELMTDDHLFVDSLGHTVQGRESMRKAWHGYIDMVPDYEISVEEIIESADTVIVLGVAGGTYSRDGTLDPANRCQSPAAWKAVVRGDKVSEWRVYSDNEPIREIMRRLEKQS